ncbi:MAG TPA: ABC transporter permease [Actinomycetota bacterium]
MRRAPVPVVVLAILGVLLLGLPVVALAVRAPWSRAVDALAGAGAWTALRLSIVVSVAATAIVVALGVPLAWLLARVRFPGRSLLRALVVLPIVLPPVVGGVGLLAALGRSGVAGRVLYERVGVQLTFTTAGAVVAAAFVSMPFVVLAAEAAFRSVDPRLEAAAATLGGRPAYVFRRVTVPLVAPQLAAGTVLAWARALGEFGATITFAGNLPGRTQTLPLAVFEARQTDPAGAVVLSLLLVAVSVGVLVGIRGRVGATGGT